MSAPGERLPIKTRWWIPVSWEKSLHFYVERNWRGRQVLHMLSVRWRRRAKDPAENVVDYADKLEARPFGSNIFTDAWMRRQECPDGGICRVRFRFWCQRRLSEVGVNAECHRYDDYECRAIRAGLSYQLRGRVGRGGYQSPLYFS